MAFPAPRATGGDAGDSSAALDTSYVAVVDRHGNAFSATPSDVAHQAPVVPGTGLCPSSRGSQSRAIAGHPSAVAPGKRPRLTPNPALARRPGRMVMPFGTPGGDVQCQAMLQTLLNMEVFGMAPQAAVEAPRFATYSFPGSFAPHAYAPGRLVLEGRIEAATGERLAALGHGVEWWPERTWRAGGMCLIVADLETGVLSGAADPRRESYAVGW
jgi:gamma-glutamyltranspeptidase/glutathione hydrolase